MRTAVISDIHANIVALEAVLRRLEKERVDEIVCLGDIVGYGPAPDACCERVRAVCDLVILGNHDEWVLHSPDHGMVPEAVWQSIEWTRAHVSEAHKEWFAGLPLIVHRDQKIYVHAAPLHPEQWEYITDAHSAARYFSVIGGATCFVGHSHLPGVYTADIKKSETIVDKNFSVGTIINVGSVGQPRDGNPAACCFILDEDAPVDARNQFLRMEYDNALVAADILAAGLPEFYAYRLSVGR